MTIDEEVLAEVEAARERVERLDEEAYRARAAFNQAVRRLHQSGGSLREIAGALGMSHQRVHQIIGEEAIVEVETTSTTLPVLPTQLTLPEDDDRCTGCDAPRREVDKLLAAPGNVFICGNCVARAATVARTVAACTYCGTTTDAADLGKAVICPTCLQACERIVGRPANDPVETRGRIAMRRRNTLIRCSFCNASQKEVRKLIAGPGVYICDLCMTTAARVTDTGTAQRGARSSLLSDASAERHACSFCGKKPQQVKSIVKGGRARICDECLTLCFDIVEAEGQ